MRFYPSLGRSSLLSTALGIGLVIFFFGCSKSDSPQPDQTNQRPLEGVRLRLLVVDDPAIARAARKVEGEWLAQTGATLDVVETTESELLAADKRPKADAAVCASYLLGPLAQSGAIVEIPQAEQCDGTEVFELIRRHEAAWGSSERAVPFGSPLLVCYYRADLLKALGKSPPRTWAEYEELALLLHDRTRWGQAAPPTGEAWCGAMEPLGPGWGGLVLMARASSSVKHPDNYSTWFNIETMEPLIDGPPTVRALGQLVAAAKHGSPDQLQADPNRVRNAFWQGRCGLALSWPTAADPSNELKKDAARKISVGFVELPGSDDHYNVDEGRWEEKDDQTECQVPLLATSGRLGVVFRGAERPAAAARLLTWLAALDLNPPLAASSPWTTLSRRAQLSGASQWVERPIGASAAADYGRQTAAAFAREQWTCALRIPGRADYLAALDEAVASAVAGRRSPEEALREAAEKWRTITRKLGVERQRAAYQQSLGLEP